MALVPGSSILERDLYARIGAGDESAFAELYGLYCDQLKSFVFTIVKSVPVAEDIVQESFLKLWLNREKISGYDQPKSWLYRIAVHQSSKHLRDALRLLQRHERAHAQMGDTDEDPVWNYMEKKETNAILDMAIADLPQRRQQIFRLYRQRGLTYKQIAEQLSISPETVKSHLAEAKLFLQERLKRDLKIAIGMLLLSYPL